MRAPPLIDVASTTAAAPRPITARALTLRSRVNSASPAMIVPTIAVGRMYTKNCSFNEPSSTRYAANA